MINVLTNLLWGTICLAAGVVILQNLDALVLFDKHLGSDEKPGSRKDSAIPF
jgi:hypothetical protein